MDWFASLIREQMDAAHSGETTLEKATLEVMASCLVPDAPFKGQEQGTTLKLCLAAWLQMTGFAAVVVDGDK